MWKDLFKLMYKINFHKVSTIGEFNARKATSIVHLKDRKTYFHTVSRRVIRMFTLMIWRVLSC